MKPALTAEEWKEVLESDYPPAQHHDYQADLDPHRNAALLLYGQPFGFTREDAKRLRSAGDSLLGRVVHDGTEGDNRLLAEGNALYEIAYRVEALLPPSS